MSHCHIIPELSILSLDRNGGQSDIKPRQTHVWQHDLVYDAVYDQPAVII